MGQGVVLEPIEADAGAWFARLDPFEEPSMKEGRGQPPRPVPRNVFGVRRGPALPLILLNTNVVIAVLSDRPPDPPPLN